MKYQIQNNEHFTIQKGDFSLNVDELGNYEETDPLFTASAAYNITTTDITNWNNKANAIEVVEVSETGAVGLSLQPNTFYKFGTINSLTITLVAGTGFTIYFGKFSTSSTWGDSTGFSVPSSVNEASGNDTIVANKTYEFYIMDNVLIVKEL